MTTTNIPRKPRKCACGCNEMTLGGHFRQGHDSKLKSHLLKAIRKGGKRGEQAAVKMVSHGWEIPEVRELTHA